MPDRDVEAYDSDFVLDEEDGEEEDEEGDIDYAAPSDLCQGVCLLHKVDEGDWYWRAFNQYYEEVASLPYPKERSATAFKPSRLRQVQSMEDMEQDEGIGPVRRNGPANM